MLAHFVGKELSYALYVATKTHGVFLYIHISELSHIVTHQRRAIGEIDYFYHTILSTNSLQYI